MDASAPQIATPVVDPYINRDLSLLEFNRRVLAQVSDPAVPLLERLRFLCISSTNLDEFFEIRVAALKQRLEINAPAAGPDRLTPRQLLDEIRARSLSLVSRQYELLNQALLPALEREGIRFLPRDRWTPAQSRWLDTYFEEEVVPVLTPLTLDPSRPFPRMLNKSLNFIVRLKGRDAFGRLRHRAVVQAPRSLPRVIRLPDELCEPGDNYVLLSSIIHAHVDELFPGLKVEGCYQFRVTRNSNLYVDDEEVDDLVLALQGQLAASRYGAAVRLEINKDCPEDLSDFLLDHFDLERSDLYAVDGPVNLNRLATVCDMAHRPDLCYPPFKPGLPPALRSQEDIFQVLKRQNVLLHHPYESFAPVVDFIARAAADPNVLAIKQTLYRTGAESPFVDHLVKAARAGKEVTVVVELMARFDEAANITLATRLQEAGAHVVYGLVGYKTHAKMALVVRREHGRLVRYVHLGTGNYHPGTARLYTDYGYFSASRQLGEDVHKLFMQLTSLTAARDLSRMLTAPFELFDAIRARIEREARNAEAGRPARIIAKLNALTEPGIIDALYAASGAGVEIDLIVRGICSLRPGIPGLSDNIRVRSIVGRFLEHSRVYYFENGGDPEYFCSSADWMDRNFFRRTEACFPIRRRALKERLKADLDVLLADNCQAWILHGDGHYEKREPGEEPPVSAQEHLLATLASPPG
ncbi:MAG TPA: polyphosphate kinase 1 [Woeseiaceae bacterium]|nr:polyphosphate kinase 1 [Woeseiaceae bacterium]